MNIIKEQIKNCYKQFGLLVTVCAVVRGLFSEIFIYGIALPCMYIIGAGYALAGKASVYHNVVYKKETLSYITMLKDLSIKGKVLRLSSAESNILIAHGDKVTGGFYDEHTLLTQTRFYGKVAGSLAGRWTLVSCYNGQHQDIDGGNFTIRRDPNTINNYPAVMLPFFGKLIVWSSKITRLYLVACYKVAGLYVNDDLV